MNNSDNHHGNIKLCVHAPMEIFLAINDMAIEDDDIKTRSILKFTPLVETQNLIEIMRRKLTIYQKSELTQFFTKGIQFTFTFIILITVM